jgi:hypothetical protein
MKAKKIAILIILCISLISLIFIGCENGEQNRDRNRPEDNSPLSGVTADVDITRLGKTMRPAQINDMYENAPNFIGKTVKIRGRYSPWAGVHGVDAADEGCCFEGFDFFMNDSDYVVDLPVNTVIEMIGVFTFNSEVSNDPYLAIDEYFIIG